MKHRTELERLPSEAERHRRLCELNVLEQVINVSQTTVVSDAWRRGQTVAVHGWIYDIADGLLRDLDLTLSNEAARDGKEANG
jgi:carbonic anhydrase